MDINFWLIQLIGIVAWLILLISYYRENTDKILSFQLVANILFCLHYYLLDAYSGLFICTFEIIRDYLYYKTDIDDYIFYGSIIVYVIYGVISFNKWYDLLPVFSSFLDGFSLTKKKNIVVIGAIVSYTMWFIYDVFVLSVSGAITDGLIVVSNLSILLFDFNPFDFKRRGKEVFSLK